MKQLTCVVLFLACITVGVSAGGKQEGGAVGKPVTLSFMFVPDDFHTDTMPRIVNEVYPNIKIEAEALPDFEFIAALKSRNTAGEGPDFCVQRGCARCASGGP